MSIEPYSCTIFCPRCKTEHQAFASNADKFVEVICSHCGLSIVSKVNKDGIHVDEIHVTRVEMEPISALGEGGPTLVTINYMTMEEFVSKCTGTKEFPGKYFLDYDGVGKLATKTHVSNIRILPSHIKSGKIFDEKWTHVVWYCNSAFFGV